MNCQEFDKCIPLFVEKKMEYRQLNDFLQHFNECKECHDELEIKFLMDYVLQNEDHISFNLSDELNQHIQGGLHVQKRIYRQNILQWVLFGITNSIALVAMVSFILFYML